MIRTGRSCVLDLRQLRGPIPPAAAAGRAGRTGPRTVLRERPFLGKIMLHVDARRGWSDTAAGLGLAIPFPAAGRATASEELSILSLTRETYLLLTPPNGQYDLMARLRAVLPGSGGTVADVSSGYATFRLSGPAASELLYRGCSTPLDAPDFVRGKCMTTKVGKIAAIIHRFDDAPSFDLHVARSLALAFWTWLVDAGGDCGLVTLAGGADRSELSGANTNLS
jgi:heterotetrameric sarcosine oxidase gamma subunit